MNIYMNTYRYTYIDVSAYMATYGCIPPYIYTYLQIYIQTYNCINAKRTYVRKYVHI